MEKRRLKTDCAGIPLLCERLAAFDSEKVQLEQRLNGACRRPGRCSEQQTGGISGWSPGLVRHLVRKGDAETVVGPRVLVTAAAAVDRSRIRLTLRSTARLRGAVLWQLST